MLKFMREKSKVILYTIVFGLVISLFTSLFFFKSLEDQAQIPNDPKEVSVAKIGSLLIRNTSFNRSLNQILSLQKNVKGDFFSQDPQFFESVYLAAWQEALQFEVLLFEAKKHQIKLSPQENKAVLKPMLEASNIASKRALIDYLKQSGLTKKQALMTIDDLLLVSYYRQKLLKNITLDKRLYPFVNKRYNLEHVSVVSRLPFNEIQEQLSHIQKALIQAQSLEAFNHDKQDFSVNKSYLGWVNFLNLDPLVRESVASLGHAEWSNPIYASGGYQFFQVLETGQVKHPIDIKDKEAILAFETRLFQEKLAQLVEPFIEEAPIEIFDPVLELVLAKIKNNLEDAAFAYQKLISNAPSNASFYLGLARVYVLMGNKKQALSWYEKADVVSDLDLNIALIQIHLEYAGLLKEKKRLKEASKQYDRALERASTLQQYQALVKIFKKMGDQKRLNKVNQAIADLTALSQVPQSN